MSNSNPIAVAAHMAKLTDSELYDVFAQILDTDQADDYQQAALDEAQLRGMLSRSESEAISHPKQGRAAAD